ncbi:wall-associated receptor kinase 17-like isoform X2 [Carex rostrata]
MPLKNHLFLLLLFIVTSMPLYSSSYINPSLPNADRSIHLICSAVPYPFGTVGTALPGFEIGCPKWMDPLLSPPFLSISNEPYTIQEISLQGYVKIFVGPIYTRCLGANGKWTESKGSGWINLDETPFALSDQYNILTVVGCNNLVSIRRQEEIQTAIRGCATFCGTDDTSLGDSCSGLGCCQAALPGTLKSFDLEVTRFSISNSSANFMNCSAAFFAQRDDFKSNKSEFLFHDFNFSVPLSYEGNIIQLDWAIGNKSCDDIDIDECQYTDVNPCIGDCINTEGSFACACPSGMTGDGRKDGSGCKKTFPLGFVLGITITLGLSLAIVMLLSYFAIVKRVKLFEKRKQEKLKHKFFVQNRGLLLQQLIASHENATQNMRILRLHELEKATNGFDNALIIGRGGHGEVYKGILSDQRVVAIKRSKIVDPAEIDQFINEVVILSQVNHRNIVKLYGCCLETEVPLLAYEFISNGTLFNHLHVEEHCSLTWRHRLRFALEAAGAISYLHSSASISVFHRDIKSSNILLDDYFTAKVSDFGASRSVQIDQTGVTTDIQGTHGYLDPEYYYTGRLTQKSDVYSFGVILAELLTKEKPLFSSRKFQDGSLVAYFSSSMNENLLFEILDPKIVNEGHVTELKAVAKIAQMCLRMKGEERPTMKEVEVRLEVLWRSNQQQEHPWTSQSLEERQLMLPDYIVGIDSTLQCRFEQQLESSSKFLSVNDPHSI